MEKATDKQQNDWSNFLLSWAESSAIVANANTTKVATPIELIPLQIFNKHCNRFENLTQKKEVC